MKSSTSSAQAPAPRLRDRLREETARTILAAAEEVFAEDGLHAARMERIAARAGVAVGTLYNHFEDRDALLAALADTRREAMVSRMDEALAAVAGRPVREELQAFLSAVVEHARAHGRFLQVLVQAGEGPASAKPPGKLVGALLARAEGIVARGVAAGELRPDARGIFGLALVGMVRMALVQAITRDAGWDDVSAAVLDLFLEGAKR